MKALFNALKLIVESSPAPLFTSFQDDFYRQDKDVITHDIQPGDTWYFSIKECGTYLVLVDKDSEYLQQLMRPIYAPERRHFLISISDAFESGFDIKEYTMDTIAGAVAKVRIYPNRKPARDFLHPILMKLEPALKGSRVFSDFTATKGAVLYLSLTANSVTYISNNGISRTLGLPFDMYRKTGAYKVKVTSDFGHAELEQIKQGVFQRAVKANTKKAA
jgi:hypothetical protein